MAVPCRFKVFSTCQRNSRSHGSTREVALGCADGPLSLPRGRRGGARGGRVHRTPVDPEERGPDHATGRRVAPAVRDDRRGRAKEQRRRPGDPVRRGAERFQREAFDRGGTRAPRAGGRCGESARPRRLPRPGERRLAPRGLQGRDVPYSRAVRSKGGEKMNDDRCCSGSGGVLLAFLAGGVIGAGLAPLYATPPWGWAQVGPRSGASVPSWTRPHFAHFHRIGFSLLSRVPLFTWPRSRW